MKKRLPQSLIYVIFCAMVLWLLTPVHAQTTPSTPFPDLEAITMENAARLQEFFVLDSDKVMSLALSPDNQTLAVNTFDSVWLYDLRQPDKTPQQLPVEYVRAIVFSPDSKLLLTGAINRELVLWDVASGERLMTFEGHENGINTVAFSPDGKFIASGDGDCVGQQGSSECHDTENNTVRLWDANTAQPLALIHFHNIVDQVRFTFDNQHLLAGSNFTSVSGWNVEQLIAAQELTGEDATFTLTDVAQVVIGSTGGIYSMALTSDGNVLAVSGGVDAGAGFVWLWDLTTTETIMSIVEMDSYFMSVGFNADGSVLAFDELDGGIGLWDVEKDEALVHFSLPDTLFRSNSLAFSSDGKFLVAGSDQGTVYFYGIPTESE